MNDVELVKETVYNVVVRNELSGEITTVSVASVSSTDAQVEALVRLFRHQGWRKAVAFRPEDVPLLGATL